MDGNKYYKAARKRVKKKQEFFGHFISYVVVIGFLMIINLMTTSYPWFLFAAVGWGIGVVFHALATFNVPGFSKEWEEKMIHREMLRMQEEEEAIRWELRHSRPYSENDALPPGELDEMDLDNLKELQKKYRDEDLV